MPSHHWWSAPWVAGSENDPDAGWDSPGAASPSPPELNFEKTETPLGDASILVPLEEQFHQVRSKERVRGLAEVFTHQREVDAILETVSDAFSSLDIKFLEPTCGSGNFLTEILRRKLTLITRPECVSQEHYEYRILRAVASIYGVDISPENVTEARGRMAHILLEHYQNDANTTEPTPAFLNAAALILGTNLVVGDSLLGADEIELCDWRPAQQARFQRVYSFALVPEPERGLFAQERIVDDEPVHYSELQSVEQLVAKRTKARKGGPR